MFDLRNTLAVLDRTPRVLAAWLRGLDPAWTHNPYGPGTWSPYNVVGHLIKGEKLDWIPRARLILAHGTSRAFDPFPHDATVHPGEGHDLPNLLDEFAGLRAASLRELSSLRISPAMLQLRGRHPALGEVTLAQLLATWAAHDIHHVAQIARGMVYQARHDVGPWRAFINTLPKVDPAETGGVRSAVIP